MPFDLLSANAKQQQQRLAWGTSNANIINLLNSSPASAINTDANTAVVNAINNSPVLPHVALNQKLLARKMTLANVNNARVINHGNLLAVNNNRMNVVDFNAQTVTLSPSPNFGQGGFTIKQAAARSDKSALSALLVGTPAADRPEIASPNTNSLLLEKLAGSSGGAHFPKANAGLSSPPPQNAINVQSLNFAPLQNISGLQNVQVQLPGFSQPISLSLNVSSTGAIQGHPSSLIVSLPVSTATCSTVTQQTASIAVTAGGTVGVGTPTVVLGGAGAPSIGEIFYLPKS